MLPSAYRIRKTSEYRAFKKSGALVRLPECVIVRMPNALGHFRLGITIQSRGRSVDRTSIKRTVREIFGAHGDRLGSFDYLILVPFSKSISYPYRERLKTSLTKEISRLCKSLETS